MISLGRRDIKILLKATNDAAQRALTRFRRGCPHCKLATSQVAAHAVVVKWKDRDVHGAAALLCIRLKVSNVFAANSERPGQRRPTGRRLPLFRHRDQAFALSLFPCSLARTSDRFRLLARLALRRFFIRLTTLHLTKNALALHLLLWDPESLIDIVVANEYPQNVF